MHSYLYSILFKYWTLLVQKKLSANWRCPPFESFFNIDFNFENKAFFYIYKVWLGWLVVSRVISDYEKRNDVNLTQNNSLSNKISRSANIKNNNKDKISNKIFLYLRLKL